MNRRGFFKGALGAIVGLAGFQLAPKIEDKEAYVFVQYPGGITFEAIGKHDTANHEWTFQEVTQITDSIRNFAHLDPQQATFDLSMTMRGDRAAGLWGQR